MFLLRFWTSVLRRALGNMYTQRRLHLLAISVMSLSLSVLGAFVLIISNLAELRSQLSADANLTVFISSELPDTAGQKLSQQIGKIAGVQSTQYRDVEASKKIFRKSLGEQSAILNDLGPEEIPASILVSAQKASTAANIESIAESIKAMPGVEDVAYAYAELRRLNAMVRIVEIAALAIGLLIALVTIIVMSNTVRLTVLAREEEINIMRLVGATDAYVQWPFILEGSLAGLSAGIIAVVLVTVIAAALNRALAPVAQDNFSQFHIGGLSIENLFFLLVSGLVLGFVGGLISVGRSLKTGR